MYIAPRHIMLLCVISQVSFNISNFKLPFIHKQIELRQLYTQKFGIQTNQVELEYNSRALLTLA